MSRIGIVHSRFSSTRISALTFLSGLACRSHRPVFAVLARWAGPSRGAGRTGSARLAGTAGRRLIAGYERTRLAGRSPLTGLTRLTGRTRRSRRALRPIVAVGAVLAGNARLTVGAGRTRRAGRSRRRLTWTLRRNGQQLVVELSVRTGRTGWSWPFARRAVFTGCARLSVGSGCALLAESKKKKESAKLIDRAAH